MKCVLEHGVVPGLHAGQAVAGDNGATRSVDLEARGAARGCWRAYASASGLGAGKAQPPVEGERIRPQVKLCLRVGMRGEHRSDGRNPRLILRRGCKCAADTGADAGACAFHDSEAEMDGQQWDWHPCRQRTHRGGGNRAEHRRESHGVLPSPEREPSCGWDSAGWAVMGRLTRGQARMREGNT
jgi:hypothetical protein